GIRDRNVTGVQTCALPILGVAVLGSIAAALYRAELSTSALTEAGLDPQGVTVAQESLAGALQVLDALGPQGAQAAARAQEAFVHGLMLVSGVGGVIMVVGACVVFFLTPRTLDLSKGH